MHPESELTGYVTDTLAPAEQAGVAAHLEACPDCRRDVEESRAVLADLAAGLPTPPPIDGGRYRADLLARVRARGRRPWWARPLVPAVVAAGMATAALLLAIHGVDRRPGELVVAEETMLGARLPLLEQYRVVERLDLLEDLEAIRHLDRLGSGER